MFFFKYKNKQQHPVYGKMCLFQNILVTHLGQNRLEYSEFDVWRHDREYMMYVFSNQVLHELLKYYYSN